jgi:hypothetical protein
MVIIGGNNPIFVGGLGTGGEVGVIAPQIKFFDVYYVCAPVVGFHVSANKEECP